MPVEGQWERANTPLSGRDKRLLVVLGIVAAVAIAVFAALYLTRSTSSSTEGCLIVDVPSTMGGSRLTVCGNDAHSFCREQSGIARLAAACRRQGFGSDVGR